ncbi:putative chitinase 10 [Nephila pilipes]|uniref:Putative chitinase 10 n=1 Tax=Nephila pilipes TaxID=299642 RepID=A0A8X6Q6H1_NEPPI|nr:putative chitinase 10 [Nephila pilipes]
MLLRIKFNSTRSGMPGHGSLVKGFSSNPKLPQWLFFRMVIVAVRIGIVILLYCAVFNTINCDGNTLKVPNANSMCPKGLVLKHLPHETDCTLFYKCVNGKASLMKCPQKLHFNRKMSVCDYPENAGCIKGDISKDQRDKSEKESPNGECPLKNPAQPVLLPHNTDCTKFYICDAGIPHGKSCQPGLHFNAKIQACDYPEKAGCDSEASKPQGRLGREGFSNMCPVADDGNPILKPHENDCRKFYACNGGILHVQICQQGLHFNPKLQACDYPENAGCETSVTKIPKGKVGKEDFKESCELAADGTPLLKPHATDCRKFYTCHNGILHLQICQSGLHFNLKLQACDFPDKAGCETNFLKEKPRGKGGLDDGCQNVRTGKTVLVPHPNDCSKYLMCDSGSSYLQTCPAGLHFNTALQSCDYPSNVQCDKMGKLHSVGIPSPFCPTINGKIPIFYRHPSNCSIYFLCSNGLAYEFVCPARLHFNLRQKVCDYEDVAKCLSGRSDKRE